MKWNILCLTMSTRTEYLARLRENLQPQVERFPLVGIERFPLVGFTVKVHDPSMSLGANRQKMREDSPAEYVSFVDDDDLVADNYVDRIFPLLDGVDYVGFRLQAYEDGVPLPGPTYHSLLCGGWFDKTYADGTKSWHRDISHLNPIKRELALAVPMYGGFAEDSRWANDLRSLGIVKTEHYIEETMYFYYSRTDKTDGVRPGPGSNSAGACDKCGSAMTVIVRGVKICNSCGT